MKTSKVKWPEIFSKIFDDQNAKQLLQDILHKSHIQWEQVIIITIIQAMIIKIFTKMKTRTGGLII
jgi:hypothetical protein